MSSAEPTLEGSEDISAHDISISTEVLLDLIEVAYPSTVWGINEISACCRGHIIDCTLWAICPGGGLLGPTSAKYWRVVSTHKTCLSPQVISISKVTDTTWVSIMAVARALTWKPQAGSGGHHPCSCLH